MKTDYDFLKEMAVFADNLLDENLHPIDHLIINVTTNGVNIKYALVFQPVYDIITLGYLFYKPEEKSIDETDKLAKLLHFTEVESMLYGVKLLAECYPNSEINACKSNEDTWVSNLNEFQLNLNK